MSRWLDEQRMRQWVALMQLGHTADRAADLVKRGEAERVLREAQDPRSGS